MPIKPELTADIDRLLSLDLTDPANALELRRGIAELVGYRLELRECDYGLPSGIKENVWYLIDPAHPEGDYGVDAGLEPTEEDAFRYLCMWKDEPPEIPDWPISVDAALTLPLPPDVAFSFSGKYTVAEMAQAICRTWLHYRRAQSAPVAPEAGAS